MNHPALRELLDIIKEPDQSNREQLLESWKNSWLHLEEVTQYVINNSVLSTEEKDFVWYKVAQTCSENLIEKDITENTVTNTSYNCKLLALRSPNGKLKEN
jgi:hypothetical protein